jgi:hypothetical protein
MAEHSLRSIAGHYKWSLKKKVIRPPKQQHCWHCDSVSHQYVVEDGVRPDVLPRCSRCLIATYCSRECQQTDWEAVHVHECNAWVKEPADAEESRLFFEAAMGDLAMSPVRQNHLSSLGYDPPEPVYSLINMPGGPAVSIVEWKALKAENGLDATWAQKKDRVAFSKVHIDNKAVLKLAKRIYPQKVMDPGVASLGWDIVLRMADIVRNEAPDNKWVSMLSGNGCLEQLLDAFWGSDTKITCIDPNPDPNEFRPAEYYVPPAYATVQEFADANPLEQNLTVLLNWVHRNRDDDVKALQVLLPQHVIVITGQGYSQEPKRMIEYLEKNKPSITFPFRKRAELVKDQFRLQFRLVWLERVDLTVLAEEEKKYD